MELPEHGANPESIFKKFQMETPKDILDFSENVNPAGPPESVVKKWQELLMKLTAYPHPEGEPFLSAVAKFHDFPKECIFAGNGAAEILALIAERYRGKKAIVVHPTFSEYEATLKVKNVTITRIITLEETLFELPIDDVLQAMTTASVLYLCTPNNPTGTMPKRSDLHKIIEHGAIVNCDIVLDEAFIDFIEESLSFIHEVKNNPHLMIVRSMTKMYAIPGIRLGYMVANPIVIKEVQARASHWNVNGIAAEIGSICLQEVSYREETIAHSAVEREKMAFFLRSHGCILTNSKANFISFTLGDGRDAKELYRDMLACGIVLRHSENFVGMDGRWLRIGMKSEAAMTRLTKELTAWFLVN